jgi:hypothetical protein
MKIVEVYKREKEICKCQKSIDKFDIFIKSTTHYTTLAESMGSVLPVFASRVSYLIIV